MKYAIIDIEKGPSNYSAYVARTCPGCVATGVTVEVETESLLREAIELHLEGMREDGPRCR